MVRDLLRLHFIGTVLEMIVDRTSLVLICLLTTFTPLNWSYGQFLNLSNTSSGAKINIRSNAYGEFGDRASFGTYYDFGNGASPFMYFSQVLIVRASDQPTFMQGIKSFDSGAQNGARYTTFTTDARGGPTLFVELLQQVAANSLVLNQTYTIHNPNPEPMTFRLIQYQDVDLLPNGMPSLNRASVTPDGDLIFSDPAETAVRLRTRSDSGTFEGYAVHRAPAFFGFGHDLYRYLNTNGALDPDEYNVFHSDPGPIAHLIPNDDSNHDFISDGFGDVAAALQWRFELLPGAKATFRVTTSFAPEPPTLMLAQLSLLACGLRGRKKRP